MLKLYNRWRAYLLVALISLLSTIILWLPFLFQQSNWLGLKIDNSSFLYIYRHFDGPLYLVVAKTLYNPQALSRIGLELPLGPGYFAAHLPLYPLLIRFFSSPFGFLQSMIVVNILFTLILACFFYFIVNRLKLSKNPLLLTIVFLLLPRFLVVRSVGAPESLFMFLILTSLYFFEKKKYLWAGLLGGLSVMTKTPGILLAPVFLLVFVGRYFKTKKIDWRFLYLGLIPLGLVVVFLFYKIQYGDFFAYFKSGDNIHLVAPYSVFNWRARWVGTAWLEDVIFYFFLYALTAVFLKDSKYRSFFYFSVVFFIATLFVQHKDIARYSLPLWPLAAITFEKFLTSKKFLWAFLIILPAIFMYGWNFLTYNVMPISNWAPFL